MAEAQAGARRGRDDRPARPAPAGFPPAAGHPAARPVRRRRLPGRAGRHGAVQPAAGRRSPRRRGRVRDPAAALLPGGPVRRRLARPLEPPAGPAARQRRARRARGGRRGAGPGLGPGRRLLRRRAGGLLGEPLRAGRPLGRAAAHHRRALAGLRQRPVDDVGGRGHRGGRGCGAGAAPADRIDRRRLRGAGPVRGAALPRGRRRRLRAGPGAPGPRLHDARPPGCRCARSPPGWSRAPGTSWSAPRRRPRCWRSACTGSATAS